MSFTLWVSNKWRYYIAGIGTLATGIILYQLLWGKLFPFSPLAIGFSKHELPNSIICIQGGAAFNDLIGIDTLVRSVEDFPQLRFVKKPEIFVFRDSISYLQRSVSRARFCTFYDNSLVISPWALKEAEEGKISLPIYIRHELTHILMYQHMGIFNAFKYPEWLFEGIAVYNANQLGTSFYPGKDEIYRMVSKGNFMPPQFFKTSKEDTVKLEVKFRMTFMYSEFACIVDYLIVKYGKDNFLQYMKRLLQDSDHDRAFKEIYGISFGECISDFRTACEQ